VNVDEGKVHEHFEYRILRSWFGGSVLRAGNDSDEC